MYRDDFRVKDINFSINDILDITIRAGDTIMDIYSKDFEVEIKEDNSPLTQADRSSHKIIDNGLSSYNLPILSEEGREIPYNERKNWTLFWLIDPLDGTKEFIKRNGEFTVNIALIEESTPIFGVVYAPVLKEIYFNDNQNSYKGELKDGKVVNLKKLPKNIERDSFVIVASKSHLNWETESFINEIKSDKTKEFISKGSSLKLCMVAEGVADIYPRLAPTMEWDTAAADAVVRRAGKSCYEFDKNTPLEYNKENLLNPYFIVK